MGELWCGEVVVLGSGGVKELWCGGLAVWGICGVRVLQCMGVAVVTKPLRANQRGVGASQRGPVEWGEFLSVRLSVHPSLPPSAYSKGSDSQCRGFEGKLEGSKGQLRV